MSCKQICSFSVSPPTARVCVGLIGRVGLSGRDVPAGHGCVGKSGMRGRIGLSTQRACKEPYMPYAVVVFICYSLNVLLYYENKQFGMRLRFVLCFVESASKALKHL